MDNRSGGQETPIAFAMLACINTLRQGVASGLYAHPTSKENGPNKMPESLNIREDVPGAPEMRADLEALRLQSAALTSAANAVMITDCDGTISWVNPAFSALTGYTFAEATGKNPRDLIKSGKQEAAVYKNLWETILAGHVWRGELVNRRKDGSLYNEMQTITPVRDLSGKITHFISIKQDITKAKASEAELKLLHEQLHQAVESSPAVHYTLKFVNKGVTAAYISANMERIMGVAGKDATPAWWRESLHPDDRERVMAILANVTTGSGYSIDYRIRHKSGAYKWVHDSNQVVRDSSGRPIELTGIWLDITERKLADERLKQSEEKFRSIVEQSLFGIYIIQGDRFVYVNEKFSKIFGYENEEIVALKSFSDLVSDKDRGLVTKNILKRLVGTSEVMQYAFLAKRKDGTLIDVEVHGTRSELGDKPAVVGALLDVTDRKRGEKKIQEQAKLLEATRDAIIVRNLEGKIEYWNGGAERIYGWKREEAIGRNIRDLLSTPQNSYDELTRLTLDQGNWHGEVTHTCRDKSHVVSDVRCTLMHDDEGRPNSILVINTDVTEKKQIEKQFIEAQRLESLGMLAAGVAHDLNNVLAPIIFTAPLLRIKLSSPGDLKIVDTIEKSAERGAALVRQILGFAHRTGGEFQATEVKHVIRGVISAIEITFPKSVRIEHHVPNDLWPVDGDATQIHQVLLNLCVNARDAMPKGGTLALSARNILPNEIEAEMLPGAAQGARIEIVISDTGCGMSPEVKSHMWEPFFTTKGLGKGTGLGLSTVRAIVANHGGTVAIESHVGRGTRFRIVLPAIANSEVKQDEALRPLEFEGSNELIVVAEDDAAVRESIAAILPEHHYRVLTARDGIEAAEIFRSHSAEVALVVTDLDMPRMNGAALIGLIRAMRPEIRILAMSGLPSDGDNEPQLKLLMDLAPPFIAKPFTQDAFLRAVQRVLHPAVEPRTTGVTILIIDDDEPFRVSLATALSERGYAVAQASDGAQGVGMFRTHPTDIVITDIVMPDQDGTATVIALRHEYPYLGIIAMSGGPARDPALYLKLASTFGANRTLRKPFDLETLLAAIREVLAESGERRAGLSKRKTKIPAPGAA